MKMLLFLGLQLNELMFWCSLNQKMHNAFVEEEKNVKVEFKGAFPYCEL